MAKKINICIVPVCFNAYEDAQRLLDSINRAYKSTSDIFLNIILADNSTIADKNPIDSNHYSYNFSLLKNNNIGYFPAFNKALATLGEQLQTFDYVMVCNVDLVVAEDFFSSLRAHSPGPETGVLAPGIYSDRDGRDLNPGMIRRPSLLKIQFMRLVCSNVYLFQGYIRLGHLRNVLRAKFVKKAANRNSDESATTQPTMYGAHGSFLIFTKRYFAKGAHVSYPRFLFGEEGFVAEQVRMNGLRIEHTPNIKVFDREHGSTSKSGNSYICAEHKKSYDYFYENFLKKKV